MQHFDTESAVFERGGGSLLYISIKKSFSTFLTFFPILAYISLSVIDNIVPFYMDAHIYIFFPFKILSEYRDISIRENRVQLFFLRIFDIRLFNSRQLNFRYFYFRLLFI